MKKGSELMDLGVISLAEGREVGRVKEVIYRTDTRAVAGLLVETGDWYRIKGLPFSSIISVGEDAIVIKSEDEVIQPSETQKMEELLAGHLRIKDSKVFSREGSILGRITEVQVDPGSGNILGLELEGLDHQTRVIPTEDVVTFGENILIVGQTGEAIAKGPATQTTAAPREEKQDEVKKTPEVKEEVSPAKTETPAAKSEPSFQPRPKRSITKQSSAEPVVEPKTEQLEPETPGAESAPGEDGLSDLFAKRQIEYLKGKNLAREIRSDSGDLVGNSGDIINDDIIELALKHGKTIELMMSVEAE